MPSKRQNRVHQVQFWVEHDSNIASRLPPLTDHSFFEVHPKRTFWPGGDAFVILIPSPAATNCSPLAVQASKRKTRFLHRAQFSQQADLVGDGERWLKIKPLADNSSNDSSFHLNALIVPNVGACDFHTRRLIPADCWQFSMPIISCCAGCVRRHLNELLNVCTWMPSWFHPTGKGRLVNECFCHSLLFIQFKITSSSS